MAKKHASGVALLMKYLRRSRHLLKEKYEKNLSNLKTIERLTKGFKRGNLYLVDNRGKTGPLSTWGDFFIARFTGVGELLNRTKNMGQRSDFWPSIRFHIIASKSLTAAAGSWRLTCSPETLASWKPITREDLPLYVSWPHKSWKFEQILKEETDV